jgi:hypothetical protein
MAIAIDVVFLVISVLCVAIDPSKVRRTLSALFAALWISFLVFDMVRK